MNHPVPAQARPFDERFPEDYKWAQEIFESVETSDCEEVAGSAGKVGHGIKLVDKRLIADTRGEKRAAKRAKGKGPAKGRGNNLKGGGIGKGKEKRKGHHQHKAGNYKRR